MKNSFNFLIVVIGLLSFSFFSSDQIQNNKEIATIYVSAGDPDASTSNDTFSLSIYPLGRVPHTAGFKDTIVIEISQMIPNGRPLSVNATLRNGISGPIKSTFSAGLTNPGIYNATLFWPVDDIPDTVKAGDIVIVQAVKGQYIIPYIDTTLDNSIIEQYKRDVTFNVYNHADNYELDSGGTGFTGRTGNLVAGFRNKNTSSIKLKAIEHAFLDSSGGGSKSYKSVVYAADGTGKPGTVLYVSSTLTSPSGTGTTQKVTHTLPTTVSIGPGQKFFVGYRQTTNSSIKAAYQNEIPVRPNSFYFSSPDSGGTWYDFRDSSRNTRLDISAIINYGELSLTVLPEGFYNAGPNTMVRDTARVYLRNNSSPYAVIDSSRRYLLNTGFNKFYFTNISDGVPYFIVVKHRNSIRTWSATGQSFAGSLMSYSFTTALSQAYINNQKLVGSRACMFSGDCQNNGVVNLADVLFVINAASSFTTGYVLADLTGNNSVNLSDITLAYNNSSAFVTEKFPP